MRRLISVWSALCLTFLPGFSQAISIHPNPILIDTTISYTVDTTWITIDNLLNESVSVHDLNVYDASFKLTDTSFLIPPLGSKLVGIVFEPLHNIDYNTELVVVMKNQGGNVAIDLRGTGKYPGNYYKSTQGLWDENLKTVLKQLVSGHTSLGYNTARDKMFMEVDNKRINGQGASQNTLEGVYTGQVISGYSSRQDAQNNYAFNTEHTFPQSAFGSAEPMKSDLYHLFPTLGSANSERGNKPFRIVSNPSWQSGGSKSNSTYFEPRAQQKGPTARAMLYYLIRYQNHSNFVSASDHDVLKSWNKTYIPSAVEQKRNEDIALLQHNRNPFIDHPLLAERINSFIGTSTRPQVRKLVITSDTIAFGSISTGTHSTFKLVSINTGNQPVEIKYIEFSNPEISILDADTLVNPGESGTIAIRFIPSDTGSHSSVCKLVTSAKADTVFIPVSANIKTPSGIAAGHRQAFAIYPSPASEKLTVHIKNSDSIQVKMYGIQGELIGEHLLAPGINILNLAGYKPGIYFLATKDGTTAMFVVQR